MVHFATVVCRSSCEHFVHVPDVLVFLMWLVGVFQGFFSFKDQLWNVFAREENVGDWAEIRCESRSLGVWDLTCLHDKAYDTKNRGTGRFHEGQNAMTDRIIRIGLKFCLL